MAMDDDEAMADARNSVEKKNGDGDRGVICSRTRVSGGVGERRKKERREGRGACVGFVLSDRCPMFGEIFCFFF